MDSLFGGSGIRTLRNMVRKRTIRTKSGATSSIPVQKLPKYKNVLTGKITFDPVMYEKQY